MAGEVVTVEDQVIRALKEGWSYSGDQATEGEVLHLLTALVYVTKPEVVVETGTYNGHGTKALVAGLEASEKGHLWSVESDPEITVQLKDVDLPRTTWVDADSLEWCSGPDCPDEVNFAWVDCCSHPAGRIKVFAALWPKMNGLLCVHDLEFYPYRDFLDPLVERFGEPSLSLPALNGIGVWDRHRDRD